MGPGFFHGITMLFSVLLGAGLVYADEPLWAVVVVFVGLACSITDLWVVRKFR